MTTEEMMDWVDQREFRQDVRSEMELRRMAGLIARRDPSVLDFVGHEARFPVRGARHPVSGEPYAPLIAYHEVLFRYEPWMPLEDCGLMTLLAERVIRPQFEAAGWQFP